MPRPLARALRALLFSFASLLALYLLLIKAPMALTRLRFQRLLADFHEVHPHQSTWADAQRLMTRWGKWGHYDGPCTPEHCDYTIGIDDPLVARLSHFSETTREHVFNSHLPEFAGRIGYRLSSLEIGFQIRQGTIVSLTSKYTLSVPDHANQQFEGSYVLVLFSQLRTHLNDRRVPSQSHRWHPWILGEDEQLDDHPDYKIGRPGGCEICERGDVTYTATLPRAEVLRLTSYDFSCLTRTHSCIELEDMLPAARDWHLYDDVAHMHPHSGVPVTTCHTVARARSRDADLVLEVDPLSTVSVRGDAYPDSPPSVDQTRARLVRVLKGKTGISSGELVTIVPFPGEQDYESEAPEHFIPGQRSLVFVRAEVSGDLRETFFSLPRCGILPSTPANVQQVGLGIEQDTPDPEED